MLSVWLTSTWNGSAPTAQSQDPTFFICQFFQPVAYAEAGCGSMWKQTWGSPSELCNCWEPWCLLGEDIFYIFCWNNGFLEVQISIWFRTNCWNPTHGTLGFPWSAKLWMTGACCSFLLQSLLFVHSSLFLIHDAGSMQMLCITFKSFCVSSFSAFFQSSWSLEWNLFWICFLSLSCFQYSSSSRNCIYGLVFLRQFKMKVWWCLRLRLNWIHSQQLLWPHSDLNQKATQHTCIVYPVVLR